MRSDEDDKHCRQDDGHGGLDGMGVTVHCNLEEWRGEGSVSPTFTGMRFA